MPEAELEALTHQAGYRIDRLAGALALTPRQLERIFKTRFGVSPKRWVTARRMSYALQKLPLAGSVKSVGWEVGYRRSSAFSQAFRWHFGIKPSEFRALPLTLPQVLVIREMSHFHK
jgi:AraC-like DNA-binding protein